MTKKRVLAKKRIVAKKRKKKAKKVTSNKKNKDIEVEIDEQPQSIANAALQLERHPDWAAGVAQEGGRTAERHGHARQMAMAYEDLLEQLWRTKFG